MQHEQLIDALNACLAQEIMAIQRHSAFADFYKAQNDRTFHARSMRQVLDEMNHAEILIEQILLLGGSPRLLKLAAIDLPESFGDRDQLDREAELESIHFYEKAINLASSERKNSLMLAHLYKLVAHKKSRLAKWDSCPKRESPVFEGNSKNRLHQGNVGSYHVYEMRNRINNSFY